MADPTVVRLLREWQLTSLIQTFDNECIDHDALVALQCNNDDLIAKLVPKIGLRAKFCKHLKAYQKLLDPKEIFPEDVTRIITNESASSSVEQEVQYSKAMPDYYH